MDIFAGILIIILSVYGLTIKDTNIDALSINQTTSIKGICAILVFFRHIVVYIENDLFSCRMIMIQDIMAQMIVVPFLFYSGYGLIRSIYNKKDYLKHLWKKRIGKLYFEFLIIWLSFFLVDILIQNEFDKITILKSLFIWESIGNSTWFLFGIIVMYICTWLCFTITKRKGCSMLLMLACVIAYYCVMYKLKSDTHWYDTIAAFYLGMVFAYVREENIKIDFRLDKRLKYILCLFLCGSLTFLLLIISYNADGVDKVYQFTVMLSVISFIFFLVLLCTRLEFGNQAVIWLGKHCFEIYMLQRIPMMVLQKIGLGKNMLLFSVICLLLTLTLSAVYKELTGKLYNKMIVKEQ